MLRVCLASATALPAPPAATPNSNARAMKTTSNKGAVVVLRTTRGRSLVPQPSLAEEIESRPAGFAVAPPATANMSPLCRQAAQWSEGAAPKKSAADAMKLPLHARLGQCEAEVCGSPQRTAGMKND